MACSGLSTRASSESPSLSDHPAVLLKIYIYGYINRVQSSRHLERECQRNVELMWLTGRLAPDFKTIADLTRSGFFRANHSWRTARNFVGVK